MFHIKLPTFILTLSLLLVSASWAAPTKILPLGDSITAGLTTFKLTYGVELHKKLTEAGYDFEFVGSLTDSIYNLKHEGH
ncbi:MAG TPA: hypothetical protein EYG71_08230, partial [Leucothrix sp.]|nr:hypothetical protein [Leucothrix sp.]